jgi:hypothetical protein
MKLLRLQNREEVKSKFLNASRLFPQKPSPAWMWQEVLRLTKAAVNKAAEKTGEFKKFNLQQL